MLHFVDFLHETDRSVVWQAVAWNQTTPCFDGRCLNCGSSLLNTLQQNKKRDKLGSRNIDSRLCKAASSSHCIAFVTRPPIKLQQSAHRLPSRRNATVAVHFLGRVVIYRQIWCHLLGPMEITGSNREKLGEVIGRERL